MTAGPARTTPMPVIFPASAVLSLLERGLGFAAADVEAPKEEDEAEGTQFDDSPKIRRDRIEPGAWVDGTSTLPVGRVEASCASEVVERARGRAAEVDAPSPGGIRRALEAVVKGSAEESSGPARLRRDIERVTAVERVGGGRGGGAAEVPAGPDELDEAILICFTLVSAASKA